MAEDHDVWLMHGQLAHERRESGVAGAEDGISRLQVQLGHAMVSAQLIIVRERHDLQRRIQHPQIQRHIDVHHFHEVTEPGISEFAGKGMEETLIQDLVVWQLQLADLLFKAAVAERIPLTHERIGMDQREAVWGQAADLAVQRIVHAQSGSHGGDAQEEHDADDAHR